MRLLCSSREEIQMLGTTRKLTTGRGTSRRIWVTLALACCFMGLALFAAVGHAPVYGAARLPHKISHKIAPAGKLNVGGINKVPYARLPYVRLPFVPAVTA